MTKWKLVPVDEITPEMINAFANVFSIRRQRATFAPAASAMLAAAPQREPLSDKRLFHYAAEIRKALEPDPIGATLNIVALLRAIEREILGGGK